MVQRPCEQSLRRSAPEQTTRIHRLRAVSGFELTRIPEGSRGWNAFHTSFDLVWSRGWNGEIRYRGFKLELGAGQLFCAAPGEVHTTGKVRCSGELQVLSVASDAFAEFARRHGVSGAAVDWRELVHSGSPVLTERLHHLFSLMDRSVGATEERECVADLFAVLMPELVNVGGTTGSVKRSAAERMRELLLASLGSEVGLEALARAVNLNRFQALRLFKARFGLPPRAYQIIARVGAARRLLAAGHSVALVAAQCGFADQSHFGRHFKRLVGITPGQYARQHAAAEDRADVSTISF